MRRAAWHAVLLALRRFGGDARDVSIGQHNIHVPFHNPCDSYDFARPAFHETTPVAAARWLPSSARHTRARPSLRNHDPLPTAHTLTISISLPAGSLQRAATNEKNFGDEENSLTSRTQECLLTHIVIIISTYEMLTRS